MEQEPIYVPSNKLTKVCHAVLGWIMNYRQTKRETYIIERVVAHNNKIHASNRVRGYFKWLGVKPNLYITAPGMELIVRAEMQAQPDPNQHPMMAIHQEYGNVEHEAKDTLIQCQMVDAVAISGGFCRAISHMGVDVSTLQRGPFGFYPRK